MTFIVKPPEALEIEQAQQDFRDTLALHQRGVVSIDEVIETRRDLFALAKEYDYFLEIATYDWWRWSPWMEALRWNWWAKKS